MDCLKLELPVGPGTVPIVPSVHAEGDHQCGDPLDGPYLAGRDAVLGWDALLGRHAQRWAPVNVQARGRTPGDLGSHPIDDHPTSQQLAKRQKRHLSYVRFWEPHRGRIGWVVKSDPSDRRYLPGVPGPQNVLHPKPWASLDQIVHSDLKDDPLLGDAYPVVLGRHLKADVNPTNAQYRVGLGNVLGLGQRRDQTSVPGDHCQAQKADLHRKAERGDPHRSVDHDPVHLVVGVLQLDFQKTVDRGHFPQRQDDSLQSCSAERPGNHLHLGRVAGDRQNRETRSRETQGHVADDARPKRRHGVRAWPEGGVRAQAAVPYPVALHQGGQPLVDDVVPQYLQQP